MEKINKKQWNLIIRWVGTLASLLVLIYLFGKVGWEEAWKSIKQLSTWRIFFVFVLVFTSRMATFARWHILLQVQETKVSKWDSLKLTFAGLFASNVLPTTIGGDVARLAGAIHLGISAPLAAASLVTDRLIGMSGMTLALPFVVAPLLSYLEKSQAFEGFLISLTLPFLGSLWLKIISGVKKVFASFHYWSKNPLILFKALGFTLIHQLSIYLIIKTLVEGMGQYLEFGKIAGIWSLTYFISLLPVSINGLGLQEVTITNLYSLLGGLPDATSIALAVLLRIVWLIGSLPGALFLGDVLAGKSPSKDLITLSPMENETIKDK